MQAIRSLALAMTVSAVVLLIGGCATGPATSPAATKMSKPAAGTTMTYHRKSTGSLGAYDGRVAWTAGTASWQGREVFASAAPGIGTSLHDPVSLAMIAFLDAAGKPVVSYDPPIDYQWPMQVGKAWSSQHMMTVHASGRTVPLTFDWKVEAWEKVTVPAGTFDAYKLTWKNSLGEAEARWVSPAEGIDTVKRHVERAATFPQGAGVLDAELLSRSGPPR